MKRIVRLTESDLARIVKRVIREGATDVKLSQVAVHPSIGVSSIYAPGEVETGSGTFYCFDEFNPGKILSATVTVTEEGKKLGLTNSNLTFTLPASAKIVNREATNNKKARYAGVVKDATIGSYQWSFTTPRTKYINSTGKPITLFTVSMSTNDKTTPSQNVNFVMGANSQFGNAAAAGN